MGYIVVDTCVWIELAGKPPLHPLLNALAGLCAPPPHKLVVPDSIRIEFERHRTQTRESWLRSIEGHLKSVRMLAHVVSGLDAEVASIDKAAKQAKTGATATIRQSMDEVDRLFAAAQKWTPQAAHHKDACDRCVELRPPAQRQNRTSVGDCLLWSAVVDLLDSACVWFCSANTNDFSDEKRSDKLHPTLATEAASKKHTLDYYNDPTKMVEDLRAAAAKPPSAPKIVATLPRYYDYSPAAPAKCPRCDGTQFTSGAYLRSQYGGLTLQYICMHCGLHYDTGDFWE